MKTSYHHGQTIKEYRKLKGWTQAKLAAAWPKDDGEEGVNVRYVQDVEYIQPGEWMAYGREGGECSVCAGC